MATTRRQEEQLLATSSRWFSLSFVLAAVIVVLTWTGRLEGTSKVVVEAFSPVLVKKIHRISPNAFSTMPQLVLDRATPVVVLQAKKGGSSSSPKRKRKRKQPLPSTSAETVAPAAETAPQQLEVTGGEANDASSLVDETSTTVTPSPTTSTSSTSALSAQDQALLQGIAKLEQQAQQENEDDTANLVVEESQDAIPLPDIANVLQQKQQQEQQKLQEEQQAASQKQKKIQRSDAKAFRDLLERQPFADADESFFEPEAYGTVSALLGEGSAVFLGIFPSGPLQVGHAIGALTLLLMATVQYPGFPLTNLPSEWRQALQLGLATTYTINVVLALYFVLLTQQAAQRGQSSAVWMSKIIAVGGLALDQLLQLPKKK